MASTRISQGCKSLGRRVAEKAEVLATAVTPLPIMMAGIEQTGAIAVEAAGVSDFLTHFDGDATYFAPAFFFS